MSSGIYIHGMKLPEYGVIVLKIDPKGNVCTTARNDYKKYNAIELPPHGRCIDADALIREWPCGFVKTSDVIENAQTILPADQDGGADG